MLLLLELQSWHINTVSSIQEATVIIKYIFLCLPCLSVGGVELSAFCGGVLWFLWVVVCRLQGGTLELSLLLRALLLSCYGKVLLIPAVIWEHDYSPLCLGLIKLFVLTSNSQAIRGRRRYCYMLVMSILISYLFLGLRHFLIHPVLTKKIPSFWEKLEIMKSDFVRR